MPHRRQRRGGNRQVDNRLGGPSIALAPRPANRRNGHQRQVANSLDADSRQRRPLRDLGASHRGGFQQEPRQPDAVGIRDHRHRHPAQRGGQAQRRPQPKRSPSRGRQEPRRLNRRPQSDHRQTGQETPVEVDPHHEHRDQPPEPPRLLDRAAPQNPQNQQKHQVGEELRANRPQPGPQAEDRRQDQESHGQRRRSRPAQRPAGQSQEEDAETALQSDQTPGSGPGENAGEHDLRGPLVVDPGAVAQVGIGVCPEDPPALDHLPTKGEVPPKVGIRNRIAATAKNAVATTKSRRAPSTRQETD
jgi:hypothetical protein